MVEERNDQRKLSYKWEQAEQQSCGQITFEHLPAWSTSSLGGVHTIKTAQIVLSQVPSHRKVKQSDIQIL